MSDLESWGISCHFLTLIRLTLILSFSWIGGKKTSPSDPYAKSDIFVQHLKHLDLILTFHSLVSFGESGLRMDQPHGLKSVRTF